MTSIKSKILSRQASIDRLLTRNANLMTKIVKYQRQFLENKSKIRRHEKFIKDIKDKSRNTYRHLKKT